MIREEETNSKKDRLVPSRNIATGIDCVAISRIEALIHKKAFIKRVFTGEEAFYCLKRKNPARHLAARFAAKEACIKALGTGLSRGIRWLDMEVVNKRDGSPGLLLTGKAGALLGKDKKIFLSLSYGAGLAVAVVVME